MKKLIFTTVFICSVLLAAPALADWDVGDGHKMHSPQLPDPNGWDVDFTGRVMADDFQCGQTGLITDVHFWASWAGDLIPPDPNGLQGIKTIGLAIFDNVPDPNPSDSNTFSKPGEFLWSYNAWRDFTIRQEAPSPQGWYEPRIDEQYYEANNHSQYFQYNIMIPEANAFEQQDGNVYWLAIAVMLETNLTSVYHIGWKTSKDQWGDDFNLIIVEPDDPEVYELRDPVTGESLDLAFVITPEPAAALALLGIGGVTLLRRRRLI